MAAGHSTITVWLLRKALYQQDFSNWHGTIQTADIGMVPPWLHKMAWYYATLTAKNGVVPLWPQKMAWYLPDCRKWRGTTPTAENGVVPPWLQKSAWYHPDWRGEGGNRHGTAPTAENGVVLYHLDCRNRHGTTLTAEIREVPTLLQKFARYQPYCRKWLETILAARTKTVQRISAQNVLLCLTPFICYF